MSECVNNFVNGMVSVIVPVYNGARFISEAIQSALDQTYKNLEVIVINDGSTDNTKNIVDEFIHKDSRVKLINQINSGVSAARNEGIRCSKGEFIALLDHDDLWLPEKLAEQIPLFNIESVVLVYGNAIAQDIKCGLKYLIRDPKLFHSGRVTEYLSKDTFISCPTIVIKRNALYRLEYVFDEDLQVSADYDLLIRLSLIGDFNFTPEVTAIYRIHGDNMHRARTFLFVHDASYMLKKYDNLLSKQCKINISRAYLNCVAEDLKRADLRILPAALLILSLNVSISNVLKILRYALFSNSQLNKIKRLKTILSKRKQGHIMLF